MLNKLGWVLCRRRGERERDARKASGLGTRSKKMGGGRGRTGEADWWRGRESGDRWRRHMSLVSLFTTVKHTRRHKLPAFYPPCPPHSLLWCTAATASFPRPTFLYSEVSEGRQYLCRSLSISTRKCSGNEVLKISRKLCVSFCDDLSMQCSS